MSKRLVVSTKAQTDLASLDRQASLRTLNAINRFAESGAGDIKALHGVHPPEFRLRVGNYRVRFHDHGDWIEILRVRHRKDAYR